MLRTTLASSRLLRAGVLGLVTVVTAVIFTTDAADARRHKKRHHVRHYQQSYSPAFASIIVDANSGATLTASNPDASRHPASLTKIMTLYLLFERLEAGKMKLDTEMEVSEYASQQAPTKLGLRPGQTIRVEDAIKGLVTKSANDASVVIAEAISGDEDDFAKLMTRKARALGMSKTIYRNANGLPNPEQVTTARDQATLGRAIQDRFPRYYRYFATASFNYKGRAIRNHNRLLGNVEGVDGIKTGYTRASGFNLVTSMRRGNRHLVGVVLGGRSGGSRDAIMRNLLAENLEKGASKRTVAAITERNPADANTDVAETEARSRPAQPVQVASAAPEQVAVPTTRSIAKPSVLAAATAAVPQAQPKFEAAKSEPLPLTSGVIQSQALPAIPGSSEPMKPVKVRTVQVKAGPIKLASAGPPQPATPITNAIPPARQEMPQTSGAVVAKANPARPMAASPTSRKPTPSGMTSPARTLPRPRAQGLKVQRLKGELKCRRSRQTTAPDTACSASCRPQTHRRRKRWPMPTPLPAPSRRPFSRTARSSLSPLTPDGSFRSAPWKAKAKRGSASKPHAIRPAACSQRPKSFTEPVVAKGDRKLYRARFAGLDRDQADAVCRTLKRSDISCITVRN